MATTILAFPRSGWRESLRDDADDDAEKQEGDTKRVPIVNINAIKELATTANKRVGATATNQQAAASTAEVPRS